MAFTIDFYNEKVKVNVASLPKTLLARFIALADRMEEYGPNLGEPHTASMGGGLFEMTIRNETGWRCGAHPFRACDNAEGAAG